MDYSGVTGATALTTGAERDPQATVAVNTGTMSGFADASPGVASDTFTFGGL